MKVCQIPLLTETAAKNEQILKPSIIKSLVFRNGLNIRKISVEQCPTQLLALSLRKLHRSYITAIGKHPRIPKNTLTAKSKNSVSTSTNAQRGTGLPYLRAIALNALSFLNSSLVLIES